MKGCRNCGRSRDGEGLPAWINANKQRITVKVDLQMLSTYFDRPSSVPARRKCDLFDCLSSSGTVVTRGCSGSSLYQIRSLQKTSSWSGKRRWVCLKKQKQKSLVSVVDGTHSSSVCWFCLSLFQMIVASMQVPTLDEITKKEQSIKEALNYKFNDKDIEDVSLPLCMFSGFSAFLQDTVDLNLFIFLSLLAADC